MNKEWFCICGHEKKDHGIVRGRWVAACKIMEKDRHYGSSYVDDCERYEAADNLTQIEFIANKKGILDKETKV